MIGVPLLLFFSTPPHEHSPHAKQTRIEGMAAKHAAEFPEVPVITVAQLTVTADNIVLVDVRSADEQLVSMIPGSMGWEDFARTREDYREHRIVAYCTNGYRSSQFAQDLRGEGFDAVNLKGGVLAWTHEGGALSDGWGDTKKLHVWGRMFDLAAPGYETTW